MLAARALPRKEKENLEGEKTKKISGCFLRDLNMFIRRQ
jgi:hypothetical protein